MVKSRKRMHPRRKTPTPKTPRPRRPTDLTLRNLRALHTAHGTLAQRVEDLVTRLAVVEAYVDEQLARPVDPPAVSGGSDLTP